MLHLHYCVPHPQKQSIPCMLEDAVFVSYIRINMGGGGLCTLVTTKIH